MSVGRPAGLVLTHGSTPTYNTRSSAIPRSRVARQDNSNFKTNYCLVYINIYIYIHQEKLLFYYYKFVTRLGCVNIELGGMVFYLLTLTVVHILLLNADLTAYIVWQGVLLSLRLLNRHSLALLQRVQ